MKTYVPTIGVLIIRDNKVLLVKHTEKAGHITDSYGLPAGRLEEGEGLEEGAIRELFEETGLRVIKDDLIRLPRVFYADIPRSDGSIASFKWDVFLAKEFSGDLKESEETIPEWVDLSMTSRLNLIANTENAIKEGLQLLDHE